MAELEEQVRALLAPFSGPDARCRCDHGAAAHVWFEDEENSEPHVEGCGLCICNTLIVLKIGAGT